MRHRNPRPLAMGGAPHFIPSIPKPDRQGEGVSCPRTRDPSEHDSGDIPSVLTLGSGLILALDDVTDDPTTVVWTRYIGGPSRHHE